MNLPSFTTSTLGCFLRPIALYWTERYNFLELVLEKVCVGVLLQIYFREVMWKVQELGGVEEENLYPVMFTS